MNFEKELNAAIEASKMAAKVILEVYNSNFDVEIKKDNSPVTLADKRSDKLIREYLSKIFPDYGFLTEETVDFDDKSRLKKDYVWIVDPLDGTKDFVARTGEFTCNIALSYKHEAVVGVVMVPATNVIYFASKNNGAFKIEKGKVKKINVNNKTDNLLCLKSMMHLRESEVKVIERNKDKITSSKSVGSSLKACFIAEGKAEISYRLSDGTKEWDTAAFQVIVEQAGGFVLKPNKERIMYNREDYVNREGFLIINNKENFLL